MSTADSVGKTPVPTSGPAVVAQIAAGFLKRAFRRSQPTVYKINGQRVSGPEFRRRVGVVLPGQRPGKASRVAVGPPTATKPSDPGYRPDLTERKIPPLKRDPAPQRPPTSPDAMKVPPMGSKRTIALVGKWLTRFGWGTFAIATLDSAIYLWNKYFPGQPLPTTEPPRPSAPGSQGGKGTNRPQLPPEIIVNPPNVTVNVTLPPVTVSQPAPAPVPAPAPPPPAPSSPVLTPTPAPKSFPPAKSFPSWLPNAVGLALPLLLTQNQKRKRRGLTSGQSPALGLSDAAVPLSSGGNYFDSGSSPTKSCDCSPKRKRGPKKKRTVCYSGTYIERAGGLRKTKRRKVKCL